MIDTIVQDIKQFAIERAEKPGDIWGLPYGFQRLDELTGGIHPGQLIIVAFRTSEGKSVFTLQVGMNVARYLVTNNLPGQVLIYSPEMHARELILRYVQMRTGIPSEEIKRGNVDEFTLQTFLDACDKFQHNYADRVHIEAESSVDIDDLCNDIESKHILDPANPVRLVVIDYLQYVNGHGGNDYERVTNVGKRLKALANRLRIPMLGAAQAHLFQPPKFGDKTEKAPTMVDIEGSRMLPKLADVVIMGWRPRDKWSGRRAEITLAKQRDGKTGAFSLTYDAETTKFGDF